jgi:molybdopterin synthase catalytic subunit
MESLVVLTRDPIPAALRDLPFPWNGAATTPDDAAAGGGPARSSAPRDAAGDTGTTVGRGRFEGPVGAWLDFYGIVRGTETTDGNESTISAIDYEAHPEMARHQLELLVGRIGATHPLAALLVIHRIGRVPVGEPSLLVRILSGHRGESLRACAELIDELKKWIPIWKHPIAP